MISLEVYCNEPSARAVGRFTQDAEVPVPAVSFFGLAKAENANQGYRYIYWVLLNSAEFVLNR